jgi:hypothetical protein
MVNFWLQRIRTYAAQGAPPSVTHRTSPVVKRLRLIQLAERFMMRRCQFENRLST